MRKYLRVKSFWDSRKILFRNCLLSLPFFQRTDSNNSGVKKIRNVYRNMLVNDFIPSLMQYFEIFLDKLVPREIKILIISNSKDYFLLPEE